MTRRQALAMAVVGLIAGLIMGHRLISWGEAQYEAHRKKIACAWLEGQAHEMDEAVTVLQQFCWRKK